MKRILSAIFSILFLFNVNSFANETLSIEKQLVGIVGAISGTVKTETRELKTGDKIYLNETIVSGAGSGTQILLLDQSTFTIGEDSEVVMDTFIYDPATNDGKIVASVKQGSLKVISGLISKKNPDSLTVEVPEGTLGSRGTEFQTIVGKGKTDTLLIGPGQNNTLGMRPGAVLVGNSFGQTLLDNPYSMTSMTKNKAPGQAQKITKNQLKKFNKKMKALRIAKLSEDSGDTRAKRKALKKELRKELKSLGLDKKEIKKIIKTNIQKDKKKKAAIKKKNKKKKKKVAKKNNKKNKKKKAKAKKSSKKKKKKAVKKKSSKKKKKAVKKKSTKKKKKVVKKKTKKKKKVVKKKSKKKKKVVKKKPKKKKKVVKKKPKKKKKKKPKKKKKKKKKKK